MRICEDSGCTHVFTDPAQSARNHHWEQKHSKHTLNNSTIEAHWNNKASKQSVDPFVGPVNKKEYDVLRHTPDRESLMVKFPVKQKLTSLEASSMFADRARFASVKTTFDLSVYYESTNSFRAVIADYNTDNDYLTFPGSSRLVISNSHTKAFRDYGIKAAPNPHSTLAGAIGETLSFVIGNDVLIKVGTP
jgi:hypothetical protein